MTLNNRITAQAHRASCGSDDRAGMKRLESISSISVRTISAFTTLT